MVLLPRATAVRRKWYEIHGDNAGALRVVWGAYRDVAMWTYYYADERELASLRDDLEALEAGEDPLASYWRADHDISPRVVWDEARRWEDRGCPRVAWWREGRPRQVDLDALGERLRGYLPPATEGPTGDDEAAPDA